MLSARPRWLRFWSSDRLPGRREVALGLGDGQRAERRAPPGTAEEQERRGPVRLRAGERRRGPGPHLERQHPGRGAVTDDADFGVVAFTDIVGFTQFTAERGDAEALALLDRQDAVVRETLPGDARVVKALGDGLLLWFPDAVAGLGACLDLCRRFEDDATEMPLWVRIGMHWGCPTAAATTWSATT